jgi:hypothetical protein
MQRQCERWNIMQRKVRATGGCWHLNWGGWACGNGWSEINGLVSNTPTHSFHVFDTIHSVPAIIMSCPALSSLHWYRYAFTLPAQYV